MISYRTSIVDITSADLHPGFFDGWWNAPDPETHLRILAGSSECVLAIEDDQVIGFVTAMSDGVLYASITLLEVVPQHQGRDIGRTLMERITEVLGPLYRVDIACGIDVVDFYARVGYERAPETLFVSRTLRSHQPGRMPDGSAARPRAGTEHLI